MLSCKLVSDLIDLSHPDSSDGPSDAADSRRSLKTAVAE